MTSTDPAMRTSGSRPTGAALGRPAPGAEWADVVGARCWERSLRRFYRVELPAAPGAKAIVHGLAHRRPVTRSVPRSVGLGLAELGYPVTVVEGSY